MLTRDSITFNNKNSFKDLGLLLESFTVGTPKKKKMTATVPFANSEYDFSYILGDENYYEDRTLKFEFSFVTSSKEAMRSKISEVTEWLLESRGKQPLNIGIDKSMHYLAEVITDLNFEPFDRACKVTVIFNANPFRYGHCLEGTYKEWDCFNFLEDVLQESVFEVYTKEKLVTLYNVGRKLVPIIKVTGSNVTLTKDGFTTTLGEGDHKNYSISLDKGENTIKLKSAGTSTVEVTWRKEKL